MQLPKAPEAAAEAAAAKAAAEQANLQRQHALDVEAVRSLRIYLRRIIHNLLSRRRYEAFSLAPSLESDPEFWQKVGTLQPLHELTQHKQACAVQAVN